MAIYNGILQNSMNMMTQTTSMVIGRNAISSLLLVNEIVFIFKYDTQPSHSDGIDPCSELEILLVQNNVPLL